MLIWTLGAIAGVVVCFVVLTIVGLRLMADDVRSQLMDDPRFVEHIGEIQRIRIQLLASFTDDDTWKYRVTGTKWSGQVSVNHAPRPDGVEEIVWARCRAAPQTTVFAPPTLTEQSGREVAAADEMKELPTKFVLVRDWPQLADHFDAPPDPADATRTQTHPLVRDLRVSTQKTWQPES